MSIDYGGLDDKKNNDEQSRNRVIACQGKLFKVLIALQNDKTTSKFVDQNLKRFLAPFDD